MCPHCIELPMEMPNDGRSMVLIRCVHCDKDHELRMFNANTYWCPDGDKPGAEDK